MNAKLRVAGVTLALSTIAGLVLLLVRPSLDPANLRPLVLVIGAWMAFILAAWLLRGIPLKAAVVLILIGGVGVQLAAMSAPPQESNDSYRYVWDGRVQAAGIDPYEYVPSATQLTGLRNEYLWPETKGPGLACVNQGTKVAGADITAGCTRLNRPTVPTIYPPVAEAYFLGVHYLAPKDNSIKPIQTAAALCAVLTTVLLLFGLRSLGRDPRMAALWAWCPTVILEAGNSAHIDVLAVGITAAALLVLAKAKRRRGTALGGLLLGLGIATKMTPALVAPAVLKRRWMTVVASAASAVVVVYLPHVLAVGSKVVGFLPGYLQQEGYTSGQRFAVISMFVTGKMASVVAVLVLGGVALAVLWFADPDQPWRGAVVMTGAALAVTTPQYQWYALLLVMLVALDGRPEWLAFAAGGYYAFEPGLGKSFYIPHHDAVGYGGAVLFVAIAWVIRQGPYERRTSRPADQPESIPAVAGTAAAANPLADIVADAVASSVIGVAVPAKAPEPAAAATATATATGTTTGTIWRSPGTADTASNGEAAARAAEERVINAPELHSILKEFGALNDVRTREQREGSQQPS
jgi:hypothetical protein